MNKNELFGIISRVLDVPINHLNEQSSPESIKTWDSFMGYVLLDEIEIAYNVKISMDEAMEIKNIGDFVKILQSKGINFE